MTFPILPVGASQPYRISNSVRIDNSANKYFSRTFGTPTSATDFTVSFWARQGAYPSTTRTTGIIGANISNAILLDMAVPTINLRLGGNYVLQGSTTTNMMNDPTGWYHVVVSTSNRNLNKFYLNGQLVLQTTTTWTGNGFNASGTVNYIGNYTNTSGSQVDMVLADFYFIDGLAVDPTAFGFYDQDRGGEWFPIKYNGSYGNNGFFLPFSDGSASTATTLGKDAGPNGNNWTPNAITVSGTVQTQDWTTDTPTAYGTRGTFAGACAVGTNQSTTVNYRYGARESGANTQSVVGFPMLTGKWYFEHTVYAGSTGFGSTTLYSTQTNTSYVYSQTAITTYGYRFDTSTGVFEVTTNGTSWTNVTSAAAASKGPYLFYFTAANNGSGINPGRTAFAYTVPTGYNPLCTVYLSTPAAAVQKPMLTQNITTYTGNGTSQTISNAVTRGSTYQFQPDIIFFSTSTATTGNKVYYDAIRGATQQLIFNTSSVETTVAQGVTAFNTTGFSVGSDSLVNGSGVVYKAAQISVGGSQVANTSGTITSTVQANQNTGVSIVTWTGTGVAGTIGHGLGVAPEFMIIKSRNVAGNGWAYHRYLNNGTNPHGYALDMTTNANEAADTTWLNNTAPTSTVFSVGVSAKTNTLGTTYIAYCFASKDGYSHCGQYFSIGGTQTGTQIAPYTGGRPRWMIIKQRSGTNTAAWHMIDFSSVANNTTTINMLAATNAANTLCLDATATYGFKSYQASDAGQPSNTGTANYIYLAFNEVPFIWARSK